MSSAIDLAIATGRRAMDLLGAMERAALGALQARPTSRRRVEMAAVYARLTRELPSLLDCARFKGLDLLSGREGLESGWELSSDAPLTKDDDLRRAVRTVRASASTISERLTHLERVMQALDSAPLSMARKFGSMQGALQVKTNLTRAGARLEARNVADHLGVHSLFASSDTARRLLFAAPSAVAAAPMRHGPLHITDAECQS